MIEIHIGILRQEKIPIGAQAIDDSKDYLAARNQIKEAIESNEMLKIFVRTRSCDKWFWDLPEYFGTVEIIDDSPEERLKRKLGLQTLPARFAIASPQIIELGLLDLPNPSLHVSDPLGWVLRHKLGVVWDSPEPSGDHFSALVNWFAENIIPQELYSLAESQTEIWLLRSSGKLHSAYARLLEEPQPVALTIIAWQSLQQYDPSLVDTWLAGQYWYRRKAVDLAEMVGHMLLPSKPRRELNLRLQTHWVTRLMGSLYD